jgi:hypothetical protein
MRPHDGHRVDPGAPAADVVMASSRVRRSAAAVVLAALLILTAATAAVAVAKKATPESYAVLKTQIAAGQVVRARIAPKKHLVTATLKNGSVVRAPFPPADQAKLVAELRAKGAKVHINHKRKRKHKGGGGHPLRYAAGGAAVVALVGGAAFYLTRGRKPPRPQGQPPSDPSPPAQ